MFYNPVNRIIPTVMKDLEAASKDAQQRVMNPDPLNKHSEAIVQDKMSFVKDFCVETILKLLKYLPSVDRIEVMSRSLSKVELPPEVPLPEHYLNLRNLCEQMLTNLKTLGYELRMK